MDALRNQLRAGAAIAATVAGLMLCVTPARASSDGFLSNVGDECGGARSPLVSHEPLNDANEGESL